jgi:hypothetical protein
MISLRVKAFSMTSTRRFPLRARFHPNSIFSAGSIHSDRYSCYDSRGEYWRGVTPQSIHAPRLVIRLELLERGLYAVLNIDEPIDVLVRSRK